MRHGPIDAADLAVRPALDPVSTAEALQRRDRNVHRLSHTQTGRQAGRQADSEATEFHVYILGGGV